MHREKLSYEFQVNFSLIKSSINIPLFKKSILNQVPRFINKIQIILMLLRNYIYMYERVQ